MFFIAEVSSNGENCIMCEMALSYAKSMLKKNATEEQIMQELEKGCNLLSGSLAKEVCIIALSQFDKVIIRLQCFYNSGCLINWGNSMEN